MADIAVIFNWSPDVMDKMEIEELLDWQDRARARSGNADSDD